MFDWLFKNNIENGIEIGYRKILEKDFLIPKMNNRDKIYYNETINKYDESIKHRDETCNFEFESELRKYLFSNYLIEATRDDYLEWIRLTNSKHTHEYSYDFCGFYIPTSRFILPKFYGSSSISIIDKYNLVIENGSSHNNVYSKSSIPYWIPNYLNLYKRD